MYCAGCGRANRPGAKFCGGCGRPLAPRCPSCGSENQPASRFCDACGASLAPAQAPAAEARKVVTIVFADLIGSTALHERLDAESARRLMDRYHRSMGAVVEAHGGTVMQLLGDGVLAGFGVPRVAEDDAIRAVRAAVGMQQAFRELLAEQAGLAGDIGLRVAVYTGEVVAGDDHTHVMGDPVNVAARLQQEARDGDVLLGESTRRLVADKVTLAAFGSFALKGRAEPVAAWRVVSLERPAGAAAIAFIGREDELERIQAVYDSAVATPAARLAVVLGSPGLGKSRLVDEFTRRLGGGATVLLAHCNAAGGATFAPLADALRGLLRIDTGAAGDAVRQAILSALPGEGSERDRIADGIAALVAGTPASPEEIFFVVRRGLASLAGVRPVVLAIDDIQWAEPLLLDLVEHLVQWGSDVPLLVLVAARPELRDARSSLATPGGLVGEVVTLAGLDAGAATRLAANAIGAAELPAAIAGRILATSEGNPLFVSELVRMLVQDGALRREGDRWTTGVALEGLEMPPTIHALLAARIERLRPEERTVLERAAVIGRHFSRTSLAQLLPREISDLDARLESLRRSELVEPDTGWFLGEPMLRFHHVLIRDAAYRRLLKNTRAELHGRFADWLEARAGGAVEHDETLGWHLEQAHQHLSELGPVDAQGRTLGERAVRFLSAAGRRALARDDLAPAANLLERALARLDPDDPARADLALDWCEALLSAGDVGNAARAIAELGRFTAAADRLRAWHSCFVGQLAVFTDPKALRAASDAVEAAAATLTSAGDTAGEAKAHSVHALVLAQLGKIGACEAALDKALAAARRAGDRRRANAVLAGAPVAALWGPGPVTRASGRCLDVVRVLRITQGAPAVEAVALRCQAVLETLRGRAEASRRMIASSRQMVEELGITQRVLEADLFAGLIELLEGDAAAAERYLRGAYEGLRAQGLGIDAAQAATLLGRALLAQGRVAEAEAISLESESLAGDSFKAAIAWRGVRAEALAARGEHASAVEFARAAVEIAAATDDLLDHADARRALAIALRAAGLGAEAGSEEKRAIELWEAKGATLLVERARHGGKRSTESPRVAEPSAAPARTALRHVRPNAATAHADRGDTAFASRDSDAIANLFADEVEVVDHPNGATLDRQGHLTSLVKMMRVQDLTRRHEPLATLGEALALCRVSLSAGGIARGNFDIGAYEAERVVVFEVDAQGQCRRSEQFDSHQLGHAVARLYERYAELLPNGPERVRAAVTARSVSAMMGPIDLEATRAWLAPGVEYADRGTIRIFGSARGPDAFLRGFRSLLEAVTDLTRRDDDVLALGPDAILTRHTHLGIDRSTGGSFERRFLRLLTFGSDGRVTRSEEFDADRDAEALARFDELTAQPPKSERRVRPNAATAVMERYVAAFAAHDAKALAALFADDFESVEHQAGAVIGREGALGSLQAMLRSSGPSLRYEPFASLGESLGLVRRWWSAEATRGKHFDVAANETEEIVVCEVDAAGRFRRSEIRSPDHLGDAVVRLYERYAELLPEGPERTRAAATACSVAVLLGPFDFDRWTTLIAPSIEFSDLRIVGVGLVRGAEAVVAGMRTLRDLVTDAGFRVDDLLALRSDALLVRWTHFGTDRASGGAFERSFCRLWMFGTDGLITRWEQFDEEQHAEALARFDELTAEPPKSRRRVRANAATANAARLDAAIAARDADMLPVLVADELEAVDHKTGAVWDRQGFLASWGSLLRARDPTSQHEPLASLGDSLALCRLSTSATGFAGRTMDVGAYGREEILLIEGDAQGRRRRLESFATDHLGDAVIRLYERYAELLADGPARARAAATARAAALVLQAKGGDPDRLAEALLPGVEAIDRRTLGTWSAHGAEALIAHYRGIYEVAVDISMWVDDVLCLESEALLVRRIHVGTDRASGGRYERPYLLLLAFAPNGLVSRWEPFDVDRTAEALARFDQLAAGTRKAKPRVRPNAATANAARQEAAVAARNEDALEATLAEDLEVLSHPTGTQYGREEALATFRVVLKFRDLSYRLAPLATLGSSLALCRQAMSASGVTAEGFDVGYSEREEFILIEVDPRGRRRRSEWFADDRLGDAIKRLYERYAELLPDGPVRTRAAATASSVAAVVAPPDVDRFAAAISPDVDANDRRTLGLGRARGREAFLRAAGSLVEATEGSAYRIDDVLGLRSDALLIRATNFGTERAGGGTYERSFIALWGFGADGRVARLEQLDVDRDADALARFDELTDGPPATRFANASARVMDRFTRCWCERDWDGMVATLAPDHRVDDRRRLVGTLMSAEQSLSSLRFVFEQHPSQMHAELLATRGERLALFRVRTSGHASDSGPIEAEQLQILELDASGRHGRIVLFDEGDLDAAYAELDTRYAAGEAAPHAGAWEGVQRFSRVVSAGDWERWPSLFSPDFVLQDHRLLGWGTRSSGEFLVQTRALSELAPDFRSRGDHVLAINRRGVLSVGGWVGSREGGPFEIQMLNVMVLDSEGRIWRIHTYDLDQLDAARARFEELSQEPAAPARIENTATRSEDAAQRAWNAHDWGAFSALFLPHFRSIDRRPMMRIETDRDTLLAGIRPFFNARAERSAELLATRGQRLALFRMRLRGTIGGSGPSEVELLQVIEVDASGLRKAAIAFGPEDLDAAHSELDERFRTGEAAPHVVTWDTTRRFAQALDARDWRDALAVLSEDFAFEDHRRVGFGNPSRDEFIVQLRAMVDLSPDVAQRVDHTLAVHDRGLLAIGGWVGTREGGAFEIPSATVMEVGPDRRIRRIQTWDDDQLDVARACFAALTTSPPAPARPIDNAATRAVDGLAAAWNSRDWRRLVELYPAGLRSSDRRRMMQLEMGRERDLELMRPLFEMDRSRLVPEVLATRGDRLALTRLRVEVADHDIGPSEIDSVSVTAVDEHGERVAAIRFDLGDLDAAYAELDARYAAGEAAPHPSVTAGMAEFKRAFSERDWPAIAARCAPDIVVHDRRLLGWETLHGPDAYVQALRQLVDLAPDTRLRIDHTEIRANGYLVITVWEGTREGGVYEAPSLMVAELDGQGRIRRFDQYDLERLEEARARFAELRPDPLRIPPNAATRAMDRVGECLEEGDGESLTNLFVPAFGFEDRRRLMRTSGDRDQMVASIRLAYSAGFRVSYDVLATGGDRLALVQMRFCKFEGAALTAEVENLHLHEVDAEGRFVSTLVFDADDRRAASLEMNERHLRAEVARGAPPISLEFFHAWNDHDLARLRATLPDDFYLNDHRRTGPGSLVGADAYVASVRAVLEQTRELTSDSLYYVAGDRRGSLSVGRTFGTLTDGGAFESVLVRLAVYRDGRVIGLEVFEPEDLEVARARFEALGS